MDREITRMAVAGAVLAVWVGLGAAVARAGEDDEKNLRDNGAHCTSTAEAVFEACLDSVDSDYARAVGKCMNVSDEHARSECFAEARAERDAAPDLCREQRRERRDVCRVLGEGRYDPNFGPERFDTDFHNLTNPNPYFPLAIGNRWEFGGAESVVIEVLDKTKLIAGVTCITVNDRVTLDGELKEDTDDWFAHAKTGDIYYAGEEVKDYESFEGDEPKEPELVAIDGSFKTGRDGAKPGIAFFAQPVLGRIYRQEFSLDNAEDLAEILSTTYAFGEDAELDRFVPEDLAQLLCDGDCVVVKEFSPLAPGDVERKYYAPGIGNFLGVVVDTGEVVQLIACNFDSRCDSLPSPE